MTQDTQTSSSSESAPPQPLRRGNAAVNALVQFFALDFRAAILIVLVDLMVFAGDAMSFGLLIPFGIIVGGVLGYIVYQIQRLWYQDDHDSAFIKAMIVGLLTAIPAPLSPLIAIPGGIIGLFSLLRRKDRSA